MTGELNPSHPIPGLSCTVGDFWSWAYSNLNENTVRPMFAEFLVGSLLGIESKGRTEWDAYDLLYGNTKIEVKSSAYVQSWHQKRPSTPRFDIAPKTSWNPQTKRFGGEAKRQADLYVFCLYPERDKQKANPLDVPAWQFWVVPSAVLTRALGHQKSVGITTLSRFAQPVQASALRAAVDAAASCDEAS